jgi:hypothetical protein
MKSGWLFMVTAMAALLGAGPSLAGAGHRPVVVELFTSQGCSSCPPADELLGHLASRPGVLAMSLPITYWDMLGWKDSLASEMNTKRQKAYAQFMGHSGVYTPQIIVDGVTDVVGSRSAAVEDAIAKRLAEIDQAQAHTDTMIADADDAHAQMVSMKAHAGGGGQHGQSLSVPVAVMEKRDRMQINVGGGDIDDDRGATVWLFHLRNQVSVAIQSGENAGRTMVYRNVVSDLRPVGMWRGDPVAIDVPRSSLMGLPHDSVAVVVQQASYGRVVGATLISHPEYGEAH